MPDPISANQVAIESGTSLGKDAWLRLKKNKFAVLGLFFFIFVTLLCFITPLIPGLLADPDSTDLPNRGLPPGEGGFLMGSDSLGRDLFSRIIYGGRVSLGVGFLATLVSLTIGTVYGSVSAYVGGRTDSIMMRIVDILYALPFMIIVIILTTFFGNELWLLFLAIGAVEWLTMSRIVRGQVLSLKKQEFVEAARSLGLSHANIIFRHILPNTVGPVIVYTTLTVPAVMLLESVLSFLGLGVQPPAASWGSLIKEGADHMRTSPWLLAFPSLFFSLSIFSLNAVGDGLRDALDVRASKD